ncbi:hypothetical protein FOCG_14684 [Fusarium oxysporum f. sp. radicis-lycopersici 26381]|uniref:Uncharacterized protein n=6 Tax=Fusarium oxysporum TaxID=5507 RepID=W9HVE4_FUSOX|nr:hypothetical protein FOXG_20773 [Fusarium oxysporum f. sp. lycopersici 4287]EWY86312.1 hypothetical protein FOYG_10892 [Fusarium oxysporum NRRL 32931]EWZ94536.1 hypothetical protein FOWG_04791 [Fusarium oxysporum f. sp. lycopersici MN25]EXA39339.1 hypothetical protein FOVG_10925 [Fusarium oxysporum f. sp. pisi HDV247]EXK38023.1 hypothetical protein FOMG_08534 [Fusarium oxysporum f. sp. melonis 26406]EXL43215.1 hypothetical protein FOCG_14684 [Fusarium oxysporum f. sp. radicis-lycopersici 26
MSGVEKTIIPMIKETTKLSYVLCIRSIVTGQQAECQMLSRTWQ